MLRWLTLNDIKDQCRIEREFNDEDNLLQEYGEEAEDTVLNLTNRSYEDLVEQFGKVPTPLRRAALMLVDLWYQHRSPIENVSISDVPYTFDLLIKRYMRLSVNENNNTKKYGCKNL